MEASDAAEVVVTPVSWSPLPSLPPSLVSISPLGAHTPSTTTITATRAAPLETVEPSRPLLQRTGIWTGRNGGQWYFWTLTQLVQNGNRRLGSRGNPNPLAVGLQELLLAESWANASEDIDFGIVRAFYTRMPIDLDPTDRIISFERCDVS